VSAQYGQSFLNRFFALAAIKGSAAMILDLLGSSGTTTGCLINSCRIYVIADAMDHALYIVQLRMIVNFNKGKFAVMVNIT